MSTIDWPSPRPSHRCQSLLGCALYDAFWIYRRELMVWRCGTMWLESPRQRYDDLELVVHCRLANAVVNLMGIYGTTAVLAALHSDVLPALAQTDRRFFKPMLRGIAALHLLLAALRREGWIFGRAGEAPLAEDWCIALAGPPLAELEARSPDGLSTALRLHVETGHLYARACIGPGHLYPGEAAVSATDRLWRWHWGKRGCREYPAATRTVFVHSPSTALTETTPDAVP